MKDVAWHSESHSRPFSPYIFTCKRSLWRVIDLVQSPWFLLQYQYWALTETILDILLSAWLVPSLSNGWGQFYCFHALWVCFSTLTPSGLALLWCPGKVQDPLYQVLQLVNSLIHHRWQWKGERASFPLLCHHMADKEGMASYPLPHPQGELTWCGIPLSMM